MDRFQFALAAVSATFALTAFATGFHFLLMGIMICMVLSIMHTAAQRSNYMRGI